MSFIIFDLKYSGICGTSERRILL